MKLIYLHKWTRLTLSEKWLLVIAWATLAAITLILRVVHFRTIWRRLSLNNQRGLVRRGVASVSDVQIGRAIDRAARFVPGKPTCFPRALAACLLLAHYGYPAELRIGVARTSAAQLEAHAWVENGGRVLVGNAHDLARYTVLPSWEQALQ